MDIVEAADRIAERVRRGRDHFDAEEDARLAMVHLLEIVGEAAAAVSDDLQAATPQVRWRGPAAMRNRLVHGYFDVDPDLVWQSAVQSVPTFAAQVRRVLDELP